MVTSPPWGPSQNQAGHTLVELVVGLGIFMMVSTFVTSSSIDGWQALVTNRARASLVTELDEATVRLESFGRKTTALPNQATVAGQHYQTAANTLILTVPAVGADGQPITGVVDPIVYTPRAEGFVELIDPGGGPRPPADRIVVPAPATASFAVTTLTKPLITTTLTATRTTARSSLTRSVTIATLARNAE